MHRQLLRKLLNSYKEIWINGLIPYSGYAASEEEKIWQRFCAFVESEPNCFARTCMAGHITGSALVISDDFQQVLLLLHRKLNKWLQLGGHSDGQTDTIEVALREAREESGLTDIKGLNWLDKIALPSCEQQAISQQLRLIPFDIDIHRIPERPGEAEHFHFDMRFLLQAGSEQPLTQNEEAKALRWIALDEADTLTSEPSMLRQFAKAKAIRSLFT